jgi:hypothetical protein
MIENAASIFANFGWADWAVLGFLALLGALYAVLQLASIAVTRRRRAAERREIEEWVAYYGDKITSGHDCVFLGYPAFRPLTTSTDNNAREKPNEEDRTS